MNERAGVFGNGWSSYGNWIAVGLASGALACHGSSGSGGPSVALTDLGLVVQFMEGRGDLRVLRVSELDQGQGDLDGDGDTDDVVAFVYDLADGSLTNTGLALPVGTVHEPFAVTVGDGLIALLVGEADQGGLDENGDGDAVDVVVHVYDSATKMTTSTALACALVQPAVGAGHVAFAVDETGQGGVDLDGDGATTGQVLHVFSAATGMVTNAQRNVTSPITFQQHAFAFTTDEPSAGGDLNGDGDATDDFVLQLYDLTIGGTVDVPLATVDRPLAVGDDDWFVLVSEGLQGLDLNGDGDENDGVYVRTDPHLGTQTPLDLAVGGVLASSTAGSDLALFTREIDGVDQNGDGDLLDTLIVLVDAAHDQVHAPGLAVRPEAQPFFFGEASTHEWLAFLVDEASQGEDRDGDGDLLDQVPVLIDRATGAVTNLGVGVEGLQGDAERIFLTRLEILAGEDWNGDGDTLDAVVFWRDALGNGGSTCIDGTAVLASSGDSVVLRTREDHEQRDLNGDGDTLDFVYVVHDFASGTSTSLGLAAGKPLGAALHGRQGILIVDEGSQGADLNADGDELDQVLFRFELR